MFFLHTKPRFRSVKNCKTFLLFYVWTGRNCFNQTVLSRRILQGAVTGPCLQKLPWYQPWLVSHKETGWFRWFLRFLKNSYLMRDRKTFLMSSATEEQAVSAVCISHIPSDSHSQVKSHIPSSVTKPIGFVSSINITFVNKVLPWCSIKVKQHIYSTIPISRLRTFWSGLTGADRQ